MGPSRALRADLLLGRGRVRKTPWLFTDELEWSQLSRAIATTGHAARRGEPHSFESLYSFLIAPAWWIHSTADAYAAIKDLNAVVMCLAAVPTYLLARMLLARRPAVVVALLSIAIPAMSYASSIVPEPLAYLWFTLAAWLAVRALAAPGWKTGLPAVVLAGAGIFVRLEFVVLPASLALAAAVAWIIARGGLTWRRVLIAAGAVAAFALLFNLLVVSQLQSWSFNQYFNHQTIIQGGLAAGALTIGLGMLPIIGGIASLWLPERFSEPAYRAFAIYLGASLVTLVRLHSREGGLPLHKPDADDRGAESLLPLAAPADRHRARIRCPKAELAARCGCDGARFDDRVVRASSRWERPTSMRPGSQC